jgi:hypothetical protein
MVKTTSFSIQTTIFEFKLKMWTNQRMPCCYRPDAPMAVSTNRHGSSAGGTDRPGQSVLLQATWAATSANPGDTDQGQSATDLWAVSSDPTRTSLRACLFQLIDYIIWIVVEII